MEDKLEKCRQLQAVH